MKCRVYACFRDAAEGSEFCLVKHGWWEADLQAERRRRAAAFPCPTGVACTGCRYCETAREQIEAGLR